jgi:hypothetical protein
MELDATVVEEMRSFHDDVDDNDAISGPSNRGKRGE